MTITFTYLGLLIFSAVSAIGGLLIGKWIWKNDNKDILEKIRAEIEKVFCISVVTNELRTPMEVKTEILQIIDKYKAESEVEK